MDSHKVIRQVRRFADRGWSPTDFFQPIENQEEDALTGQEAARITALTYIADEAGHADMITIKRVANIALGREWNRDRTPACRY